MCECNNNCGDFIFNDIRTPIVGTKVPDMELEAFQDEDVKKIKLSDYKGKWAILFFYPADFTFICPTELGEMADMYDEFKKEDTEVLSVSTDTVFVHKAWHDESETIKKIKFPMVADPTGNLSRAMGVYLEDEGVALRGTFVINPEGEIVLAEVNDNSIGRSAKELMRKLRAAKFVNEHSGMVCPASWEEGDDTLEPGLDLVGKI
ncbi:alkyl hydroperoxide reductase subunit C [Patescibacteria group bacterium]